MRLTPRLSTSIGLACAAGGSAGALGSSGAIGSGGSGGARREVAASSVVMVQWGAMALPVILTEALRRATGCADPADYKRISYDVATDAWTIAATPFSGSGHAYDGNALDPATGDHYFALFGQRQVNRLREGTWSKLSDLPWTPNVAEYNPVHALLWFGSGNGHEPDRGRLDLHQ